VATIKCDDAVRANDPAWILVPLLAVGGGQVDGIHMMEHYYSHSRQPIMRLSTSMRVTYVINVISTNG